MTDEPYQSTVAAEATRDCYEKVKERAGKDPICWGPIFNQGGTRNYNIAHTMMMTATFTCPVMQMWKCLCGYWQRTTMNNAK